MTYFNSRSVRFPDDSEMRKVAPVDEKGMIDMKYKFDGTQKQEKASSKQSDRTIKSSLKNKVLSRVFSEDYEREKRKILDPRGPIIGRWNKIFLAACLVSLFVDPLFFYLPEVRQDICIDVRISLEVVLTIIRTMVDMFYIIHIFIRFRTAYVAPSSRVLGRGELVIDPSKIASRYFRMSFWIDLFAALPLPQVLIWFIIPNESGSMMANTRNILRFFIIFQYIPRLYLIFPLSSQIVKATGVATKTAWAGAAYNLMLFMLASHVIGACWYLLSIERQEACWRSTCQLESGSCQTSYFYCHTVHETDRTTWFESSNITSFCNPSTNSYLFGIYANAVTYGVTSTSFFSKYFYCLWWGLQNLRSRAEFGPSSYRAELEILASDSARCHPSPCFLVQHQSV